MLPPNWSTRAHAITGLSGTVVAAFVEAHPDVAIAFGALRHDCFACKGFFFVFYGQKDGWAVK
jgi:hypothetical protein